MRIKNKKIISQILDECIRIQNEGIGHAFFELSGHVNLVDVKVFIPKWGDGKDPDIYFENWGNVENKLKTILSNLRRIKKN